MSTRYSCVHERMSTAFQMPLSHTRIGTKEPWAELAYEQARPLERHRFALARIRVVVLADLCPVDHLPKGRNVLWPTVPVFEVVGMFPHVDAHDRDKSWLCGAPHQRVVLVAH